MTTRPVLSLACVLYFSAAAAAQDRVTIQKPNTLRPIILSGQILDYTGQVLTIRGVGSNTQTIGADAVVGIETNYEQDHLDALAALTANETDKALDLFAAALKREPREWVKREIMAGIVRCHLRHNDWVAAARQFIDISRSDDMTRHWGTAPLVWSPLAMNAQLLQQARLWMGGDMESARLIGASWLLLDPMYGEAAQHEMRRLSQTTNGRVSSLAKTQAWRVALATNDSGAIIVDSWRGDIERLPENLRGGPQYLLARALLQADERRLAAAELLRVPLVYAENEWLAARALGEAAELLQESGLEREADTLYAELLARYGWSAGAAESKRRLRNIQNSGTVNE